MLAVSEFVEKKRIHCLLHEFIEKKKNSQLAA
jgi:hypothetical protein